MSAPLKYELLSRPMRVQYPYLAYERKNIENQCTGDHLHHKPECNLQPLQNSFLRLPSVCVYQPVDRPKGQEVRISRSAL